MPIYEFHCSICGEDFEELVLGQPSAISCPKCKERDVKKRISTFAFKSGNSFVSSSSGSGCNTCTSHNCGTCGSS